MTAEELRDALDALEHAAPRLRDLGDLFALDARRAALLAALERVEGVAS